MAKAHALATVGERSGTNAQMVAANVAAMQATSAMAEKLSGVTHGRILVAELTGA